MMPKRSSLINWKITVFIQVEESTDFTNIGYIVAFVKFVNDDIIQETFLLQRPARNKQKAKHV
jgi:hypothetical protein